METESSLENLQAELHNWEEEFDPNSIPKIINGSGIEIKPLYTTLDVQDIEYVSETGFPGQYPFTRGIHPFMYRTKPWTIRQYSGYATVEETNKHYRFLVEQGATGMSVAFHLLTQMGYDSDNPDFEGDVGGTGVAVDSLKDMEALFDGIPLDKISTSFTINATTPIILAMYVVAAEKRGVPSSRLTGTVQNDILKEFISRGAFVFPVQPAMKMVCDVAEYCAKYAPKFIAISCSGYHIREAGSNAVQEVAYTFLNAITYVEHLLARGLPVDSFASNISWNFSAHMDFFEEIAKLRAARRLWAKIMRNRFKAQNPKSWRFQLFAGNGGSTLTMQQPDNNIIRGTLGTLALVLAGCQASTTNTKDEGLAIPTPEAQQIALRTQQIIALESGVTYTVDPLAGSYYIESLTKTYEKEIEKTIAEVERMGGMIKAIEEGYIQRQLLNEDYEMIKKIQSGEKPIVGVNVFQTEEKPPVNVYQRDWGAVRRHIAALKEFKATRPQEPVQQALNGVREATKRGDNLMPSIIEAVRAYATVGEISEILREAYGRFKEPAVI